MVVLGIQRPALALWHWITEANELFCSFTWDNLCCRWVIELCYFSKIFVWKKHATLTASHHIAYRTFCPHRPRLKQLERLGECVFEVYRKTPCTEIICKTCIVLKANTSESQQWQTHLAWRCECSKLFSVTLFAASALSQTHRGIAYVWQSVHVWVFCTGAMHSDSTEIVQFEVLFPKQVVKSTQMMDKVNCL